MRAYGERAAPGDTDAQRDDLRRLRAQYERQRARMAEEAEDRQRADDADYYRRTRESPDVGGAMVTRWTGVLFRAGRRNPIS